MLIADSSFLVSLFLPYDENHKQALSIFSKLENEIIVIPNIVLYETLTVLLYKENAAFAKKINFHLEKNMQIQIYYFNNEELDNILNRFLNQGQKLSFVDASVLYHAEKTGFRLLCFDKEMKG